jgi:hypothetical protein
MSGNTITSVRKRDSTTQKNTALGYKNLAFAHQATADETGINPAALTLPTLMSAQGFTNPSASEIANAQLFTFRKNLHIESSLRGVLIQDLAYRVNAAGTIMFIDFTSEEGEIFRCNMLNMAQTGLRAVDGRAIVATGTLFAGETDFNVGALFEVNKYPNAQIGAIIVDEDGFTQRRHTGNGTTGGNYQEIDNGTGYGTIIQFTATAFDREIAVFSNGILIDKPTLSHSQEIERLQGLIDTLTDCLAEVSGLSVDDLKSAATQPDLKAFGDQVLDLQRLSVINSNTTLLRKRFQRIAVNTSSGPLTITLPATPELGDRVLVLDHSGTFTTNNATLARNGNLIFGMADDLGLIDDDDWAELTWVGGARGWIARG